MPKNTRTEEGEIEIEEPEPIYTLQEWRKRGYKVKKGEHALAAIEIWIPKKKNENTSESREEKEKFIKKKSYFFKQEQVEKE